MKLAAALTLGMAVMVPALSAQTPVEFGLGVGLTVPTGATSNGLKTGWHGTALAQFKPASSPVGFQIDAAYQHLGFEGGGGKYQIWNATGNVLYSFDFSRTTRFRPYLIGGGGIYNVKAKPDAGVSVSDTRFGINVGGGFNFILSGVGFFVEARFHNVLVTGSDFHFIPITAGVRFGT